MKLAILTTNQKATVKKNRDYTNVKIKTNLKILKGTYNFVPLINVMFLLLIFFMLSNSFIKLSSINITLPSAIGQPTNTEKLVVTIDKNSNFYFRDQLMNFKTLKEQLAKIVSKYQINSIIIRADKNTPHGTVANLLAFAGSLKLNVYFAVKPIEDTQISIETEK